MFLHFIATISFASFYEEWKKQFDNPTESFLENHPKAPLFKDLQAILEKTKPLSRKWCQKHTCITAEGALKCFEKTHDVEKLRRFWRENLDTFSLFLNRARPFLKPVDHHHRINRFLYEEKIPFNIPVDHAYAPIMNARQKCLKGNYLEAERLVYVQDSGLLYTLIFFFKKNKNHERAIEYLQKDLDDSNYLEAWGNLRLFYGRYLMERGRYDEALRILDHIHPEKATDLYANLEFLKGLIYYLSDNKERAYHVWSSLYRVVKKRTLKSQTAYWLSKCNQREKWLHVACQYPLTFYGEVASYLLKTSCIKPSFQHRVNPFFARELLSLPKSASRSDVLAFIEAAVDDTDNHHVTNQITKQVHKKFGPFYAVWISKKFARYFYVEEGYPLLDQGLLHRCLTPLSLNNPLFRTFLHALVRQESLFDPKIKSYANAIGLTQLLPSTAQLELPYLEKLYGVSVKPNLVIPYNNVIIGSCHLKRLLSYYNNNFILAAAAYNAGKNRVDEWLKDRLFKKDPLLWIEMIPFSETRDYVKKLTENVVVYGKKFHLDHPLEKALSLSSS